MALVSVRYTEQGKFLCYEGLTLHINDQTKEFSYGSIIQDWMMMLNYLAMSEHGLSMLYTSSTLDHFFFDGGGECCDVAYLYINDGEDAELKYQTSAEFFFDGGIEIFVPKGKKYTWKEMKEVFAKLRQKEFYRDAAKQLQ